ncbi:MAG: hypothetical protein ACJA1A_002353 [Saprospiraceae bacterium]|jgi:hypothetical protein
MKLNYTIILSFLISTILFYNCAPVPIARVSLDKEDVGYWQRGTAIGEKIGDDLIVEAVYSHSDKKFDYFDIAIENTGEERVLIDPKTFRLLDPVSGGKFKGVDPELMILNLEMKDSKRKANNKTLAIVAGAAIIAGTAAAIAADGGGSSSGTETDDEYFYYGDTYLFTDLTSRNLPPMSYQYFGQEPLLSTNYQHLPDSKQVDFWKGYTFRKSTLFQNQRMRGLVAFMKDKNRTSSILVIPTETEEFTFGFVHEKHKP